MKKNNTIFIILLTTNILNLISNIFGFITTKNPFNMLLIEMVSGLIIVLITFKLVLTRINKENK